MLSRHSLFSFDWFLTVCRLTTTPRNPRKHPARLLGTQAGGSYSPAQLCISLLIVSVNYFCSVGIHSHEH